MTVRELIETLNRYEPDMEVLVQNGGIHFAPLKLAVGDVRVAQDFDGHPIYHDFHGDGLSKTVLAIVGA